MNCKILILAILAVSLISLTALGYSAPETQKLSTTAAIISQDNGANLISENPHQMDAKSAPCPRKDPRGYGYGCYYL
ncbi:MAG: hypothetical protein O8C62_07870 [Candidatus Methanoperedens sp.]|nr:hypothetical protein [Candidatus Methanoperedens sp.]